MKRRIVIAVLLSFFIGLPSAASLFAQDEAKGGINWVEGYVRATGNGTSDRKSAAQARLLAMRAARVDAQRNILEMIKGVKVDSQTTVENFMVTQDIIRTNVSGVVKGARIVKESVEKQPDGSFLATTEMQICINQCKDSSHSLVQALSLDKKADNTPVPPQLPEAAAPTEPPKEPVAPKKEYAYDRTKPVTGVVFDLEGRMFERVIMPVVVTMGEDKSAFTVYSAKSVKPKVIRTYGVVRYADTVDQALKIEHLGGNVMVIPVEAITQDKMILIKMDSAQNIQQTTRYGNDYLGDAKVVISAK